MPGMLPLLKLKIGILFDSEILKLMIWHSYLIFILEFGDTLVTKNFIQNELLMP